MSIISKIGGAIKKAAKVVSNFVGFSPLIKNTVGQSAAVYNAGTKAANTVKNVVSGTKNTAALGDIPSFATPTNGLSAQAYGPSPINSSGGVGNAQYGPAKPTNIKSGSTNYSYTNNSNNKQLASIPVNTVVAARSADSTLSAGGIGGTQAMGTGGGAPSSTYNPSDVTAGNIANGLNPDGTSKVTGTTGESVAPELTAIEKARQKVLQEAQGAPSMEEQLIRAREDAQLRQRQEERNQIANMLNSETTRMNLDLQSLRGVGAREGVTEAVYGQQSAEVTREAMARILPLQAQLAMANDNVQQAQDLADTLFSAYSKDAQNKYDTRVKVAQANLDFLTADEKKALDAKLRVEDQNLKTYNSRIDAVTQMTQQAFKDGNVSLGNALMKNTPPKYTGTADDAINFKRWEANVNNTLSKYGAAAAQAAQTTAQAQSPAVTEMLSLANNIIGKAGTSAFKSVVGLPGPSKFIPGTQAQTVRANINQLQGLLSLENRQKLKGSGAISDYESKVLQQSASSLNTLMPEIDFVNELKRVRGVMLSASGQPVSVIITDPKTGQSKNGTATREQIEGAANGGYIIQYN